MTHCETSLVRASTSGIPEAERFVYWREAICEVYAGIEPELPEGPAFDGRFEALSFGKSRVGRIVAPGHLARRSAEAVRRTPDDSLFINYCESSDYRVEDPLGADVVRRGTPRLLDNAAAFTVHFPERGRMTLHSLRLPRDAFERVPALAAVNAALAGTALGRLIAEQFRLLGQAICLHPAPVVAALGRSLETLVLALVENVGQSDREPRAPATTLDHLKDYVRARFAEPGLSISTVADAFHCTARTVQSRFAEADETFSSWLLDERLSNALSMLRVPLNAQRSVEWIAYRSGFTSMAYFHRSFKTRFGMTPGQARGLVAPGGGALVNHLSTRPSTSI